MLVALFWASCLDPLDLLDPVDPASKLREATLGPQSSTRLKGTLYLDPGPQNVLCGDPTVRLKGMMGNPMGSQATPGGPTAILPWDALGSPGIPWDTLGFPWDPLGS